MLPVNALLVNEQFDAVETRFMSTEQTVLYTLVSQSNTYAKLIYLKPYIRQYEKEIIEISFEKIPYNKMELFNAVKHAAHEEFLNKIKYSPENSSFVKCKLCNEVLFDNCEDKKKHFFGWCEPAIELLLSAHDVFSFEAAVKNLAMLKVHSSEVQDTVAKIKF